MGPPRVRPVLMNTVCPVPYPCLLIPDSLVSRVEEHGLAVRVCLVAGRLQRGLAILRRRVSGHGAHGPMPVR